MFLLSGRKLKIKSGHDLSILYNELPEFLKKDIEERYRKQIHSTDPSLMLAFIQSVSTPKTKPSNNVGKDISEF